MHKNHISIHKQINTPLSFSFSFSHQFSLFSLTLCSSSPRFPRSPQIHPFSPPRKEIQKHKTPFQQKNFSLIIYNTITIAPIAKAAMIHEHLTLILLAAPVNCVDTGLLVAAPAAVVEELTALPTPVPDPTNPTLEATPKAEDVG
jgi:hypothetical protein